jgi:hypothetical protein
VALVEEEHGTAALLVRGGLEALLQAADEHRVEARGLGAARDGDLAAAGRSRAIRSGPGLGRPARPGSAWAPGSAQPPAIGPPSWSANCATASCATTAWPAAGPLVTAAVLVGELHDSGLARPAFAVGERARDVVGKRGGLGREVAPATAFMPLIALV